LGRCSAWETCCARGDPGASPLRALVRIGPTSPTRQRGLTPPALTRRASVAPCATGSLPARANSAITCFPLSRSAGSSPVRAGTIAGGSRKIFPAADPMPPTTANDPSKAHPPRSGQPAPKRRSAQ
jgi:hypothetical protein